MKTERLHKFFAKFYEKIEFSKRLDYRIEFCKRSDEFGELVRSHKAKVGIPLTDRRLLFLVWPMAEKAVSPIEILFTDGPRITSSYYLQYYELPDLESPDRKYRLALNAVNKKDKTITIKIHLDQQKEDIKNDLDFLLKLLDYEAKKLRVDLGTPKKPQWDVYDKYLQVYDLHTKNPNMTWSEIAERIFPDQVEKNRMAVHRRVKRKVLATDTAVSTVFRYWKEANKMINEGGWRQI